MVVEAAAILQKDYPKIRFNLAGGGYQFDNLREHARKLDTKRELSAWGLFMGMSFYNWEFDYGFTTGF